MLVTGNHVWQQRELIPFLNESKQIVRPLNYPEALPGRGAAEIELPNGKSFWWFSCWGGCLWKPSTVRHRRLKNF